MYQIDYAQMVTLASVHGQLAWAARGAGSQFGNNGVCE